jgi:hypothetical protein
MTSADDQMAEVEVQKKFVEKECPRCKSVRPEEYFPSAPFNKHLDEIYTPPASIEKEIRLLKLSLGLGGDPLRCSLQLASLDDARCSAFIVLLGNGNDRIDIMVNGQDILTTGNLENALRRLRDPNQV